MMYPAEAYHNIIVVQDKPFAVKVPCFCRDWSIPIQQDGMRRRRWVCILCGKEVFHNEK